MVFPFLKIILSVSIIIGCLERYSNVTPKNDMPMQIFTQEEMTPSEKVIKLIKQIAYTYRVTNNQAYCLN